MRIGSPKTGKRNNEVLLINEQIDKIRVERKILLFSSEIAMNLKVKKEYKDSE